MGIKTATQAADRLFGFFPQSAASDPQIFMAGVVELLAGYPAWVADRILSPAHGLPAHHTFLPSIKEIRERCEDEFKAHRYVQQFEQTSEELRAKHSAPLLAGPPPAPRPTYDELKAKYGPNWGLKADEREGTKRRADMSIDDMCRQAGVSREEFEAINARAVDAERKRRAG
jgi:hypothetical protein